MRIRSLLLASLLLASLLLGGLLIAIALVHDRLSAISAQQIAARGVLHSVSSLLVLSNEYALHASERTVEQWRASHARVVATLADHADSFEEAVSGAAARVPRLASTFEQIVAAKRAVDDPLQQRRAGLLLEQMLTQTQALFDSVRQWESTTLRSRGQLEGRFHTLAVVVPLLMLALLAVLSVIIGYRVLRPLARVHDAVQAVARGDLSVRCATAHNDELGLVSRTFDAMAIDLVGQLRARQALLNQIFDAASVGIFLLDQQGSVSNANRRMGELFGRAPEELLGRCYAELIGSASASASAKGIALVDRQPAADERFDLEQQYQRADGTYFWGHLTASRFIDHEGRAAGVVATIADVSDRRRNAEELKRSQLRMLQLEKLSALGTLVGGVAHEVNNPLMGIRGYLEFAIDSIDEGKPREMLGRALGEVGRITRIVRNMLVFSRMEQPDAGQRCDPASVITASLALAEGRLKQVGVLPELRLPEQPVSLRCPADTLQQILLNLLLNACDALHETERPRRISIVVEATENQHMAIRVIDNGPGVAPEMRERIFDPFFTTKSAGSGTGLGLSVSRQLAGNAGGRLTYADAPEGGAAFSCELERST